MVLLESPRSLRSAGLLLAWFCKQGGVCFPAVVAQQLPGLWCHTGTLPPAREVPPGLYICTSPQGTPAVIILTSHWMSVLIDTDEMEGLFSPAAEKQSPSEQ